MHLATNYKSKSQIARVTTEAWVAENLYCPSCARYDLVATPPNTKVIDFICGNCEEKFQLKAKARKLSTSIAGAEYKTALSSIQAGTNPSLLLLIYCPNRHEVLKLLVIHRLGITASTISARKPLGAHTRRAGNWQGFNYLLKKIRRRYFISVITRFNPRVRFSVAKKFQVVSNKSFQRTR